MDAVDPGICPEDAVGGPVLLISLPACYRNAQRLCSRSPPCSSTASPVSRRSSSRIEVKSHVELSSRAGSSVSRVYVSIPRQIELAPMSSWPTKHGYYRAQTSLPTYNKMTFWKSPERVVLMLWYLDTVSISRYSAYRQDFCPRMMNSRRRSSEQE